MSIKQISTGTDSVDGLIYNLLTC